VVHYDYDALKAAVYISMTTSILWYGTAATFTPFSLDALHCQLDTCRVTRLDAAVQRVHTSLQAHHLPFAPLCATLYSLSTQERFHWVVTNLHTTTYYGLAFKQDLNFWAPLFTDKDTNDAGVPTWAIVRARFWFSFFSPSPIPGGSDCPLDSLHADVTLLKTLHPHPERAADWSVELDIGQCSATLPLTYLLHVEATSAIDPATLTGYVQTLPVETLYVTSQRPHPETPWDLSGGCVLTTSPPSKSSSCPNGLIRIDRHHGV